MSCRAILILMGCFQVMDGQTEISRANAPHYTWGEKCDGWYLSRDEQATIIQERMPPGTSEMLHKHTKSRQFFYVLAGAARMEHNGQSTALAYGQGIEIPPGVPHRISNSGTKDLEILVISRPPSHDDRIDIDASGGGRKHW